MSKVFVPIIIGSKSDEAYAKMVSTNLKDYGVDSKIRVASAHKSIHHLLEIITSYEKNKNVHVYITIAGRSNALSAVIDANSIKPVIAYPVYSGAYSGADIFSSLRVPSGVAPAVVLEPKTAALLALKILAIKDEILCERIKSIHKNNFNKIIEDDSVICAV